MKKPNASECFCTNIRRGKGAVLEFYNAAFAPAGLRTEQYTLLRNLRDVGPATAGELSLATGLERTTLVRNLRILEKSGWAAVQSAGARRVWGLTPVGRTVLENAVPIWRETQARFTQHMGEKDAKTLMRLLQKAQGLKWNDEN